MFKNYLLIAVRNIQRHKFYSVLNILGLAVGIAAFVLIGLWANNELGYDRHFDNAERIYRIETSLVTNGIPSPMAATDPRIAERLRRYYPEIENSVRVVNTPTLISYGNKHVYETNTYYADSTFFDIFSYSFVAGNSHTALNKFGSIVLTQDIAQKLFGNEDAVGKTVLVNNTKTRAEKIPHLVTGVIKDGRIQSHFHPEVVIPKFRRTETFEHTYLLLRKGDKPETFTGRIWKEMYESFFKSDYGPDNQDIILNRLQPLTKIHLSGNKWNDLEPNSNILLVFILSAVGLLILLIACVNYINLATAQSFNRAREVGVRRVLGASKRQLVTQFLLESIVLCVIAFILALCLVEMVLPFFNSVADRQLSLDLADFEMMLLIIVLPIIIGGISGLYPAFFLSSFQPIKALKGATDMSKNKPTLRKTIVVLQFSISIIMLVATMVIARQLDFLKEQKLGFDKERVLLVNLYDQQVNAHKKELKEELLKHPGISKVSVSYNVPGSEINHTFISFEQSKGMVPMLINSMFVDIDYADLMGLQFVDGKNFDSSMLPLLDTKAFVIVNESAVKLLGWKDPIGKKIETGHFYGMRKGYCIGVVKDFHATSLHQKITPLVLTLGTIGRPEARANFLSVKIKDTNINETIAYVERTYKSFGQGYPFEYTFLDKRFDEQYQKEEKQKTMFNWFATVSIFISCLGLVGLASFFTRQRSKEICIRKISGASVASIVLLLLFDFIILVIIALVVATPVAWYAMNKWLGNFAYSIDLSWYYFAAAGLISVVIVVATIGVQALIAARANPVSILKYE